MRALFSGALLCCVAIGCGNPAPSSRSDDSAKAGATTADPTKKQQELGAKPAGGVASAADIAKLYKEDKAAAMKQYPKGPMTIEGTVNDTYIDGRDGSLTVYLKGHDKSRVIICKGFDKSSAQATKAKLKEGQVVKIKGVWESVEPILGSSELVE